MKCVGCPDLDECLMIDRILLIEPVDISKSDGPSVNEREFITALHRVYGDRLTVILPRPEFDVDLVCECRCLFVPASKSWNPLSFILQQSAIYFRTASVLQAHAIDLVVARLSPWPLGLALVVIRFSPPIAIRHLAGHPYAFLLGYTGLKKIFGWFVAAVNRFVTSYVIHHAQLVDVCTEQHAKHAKSFYHLTDERILLIGNSVNVERFYPCASDEIRRKYGIPEVAFIVGYVGGKPWERGGEELIRVASYLNDRIPSLRILIVGGGEGVAGLRQLAIELNVADRVIFTGLVPYDAVPDYVNVLDMGIAFDIPDRVAVVGNANQKIRQYLACGKPVVTTPGGNEFLVQEQLGWIISKHDLDEFANVIVDYASWDDEKKQNLSKRAVDYARHNLSFQNTIHRLSQAWNDCYCIDGCKND